VPLIPIIKICGLSTPETLHAAIDAGADWVGLVSFPKSPRHVQVAQARVLAGHARGRATIVMLTVDADDALLDRIMQDVKPDILQLHGHETPQRIQTIKSRYPVSVMKAIGIAAPSDLDTITPYLGVADHLLLDAKPPKDAVLPGGNGAPFDWNILKGLPADLPFMLSGGLSADNVAEAVQKTRPFGVDVSSGVESAPGVKDIIKIERFIHAARMITPAYER